VTVTTGPVLYARQCHTCGTHTLYCGVLTCNYCLPLPWQARAIRMATVVHSTQQRVQNPAQHPACIISSTVRWQNYTSTTQFKLHLMPKPTNACAQDYCLLCHSSMGPVATLGIHVLPTPTNAYAQDYRLAPCLLCMGPVATHGIRSRLHKCHIECSRAVQPHPYRDRTSQHGAFEEFGL
jgi:hypothetical protein